MGQKNKPLFIPCLTKMLTQKTLCSVEVGDKFRHFAADICQVGRSELRPTIAAGHHNPVNGIEL